KRVDQHIEQPRWPKKRTQSTHQFPIAASEAADQHKRKKDSQAQSSSEQRKLGAVPTRIERVQQNRNRNGGISQPVGNAPPARIGDAGGQSKNCRENPDGLIHVQKILNVLDQTGYHSKNILSARPVNTTANAFLRYSCGRFWTTIAP